MKTILRSLAVACALTCAAAGTASAQFDPRNFYFSVDAGGILMQHLIVNNVGGQRVSADPGFRTDFAFGYNFSPFFATEIETGVIANQLDTSSGAIPFYLGGNNYLYQVPILANFILKAPLRYGIKPYIGAGAGGVASTLYLDSNFNGYTSDTDFTFAYQGLAGVKWSINRHMELGIGYKFLGTLDHTWFGNNPALVTQTGNVYTHSIMASFTWRF